MAACAHQDRAQDLTAPTTQVRLWPIGREPVWTTKDSTEPQGLANRERTQCQGGADADIGGCQARCQVEWWPRRMGPPTHSSHDKIGQVERRG